MDRIRTIGIDPGLVNVGLCVSEFTSGGKIVHVTKVISTGKMRDQNRHAYIHDQVRDFIQMYAMINCELAVVEHYAYEGFKTIDLAEISGILKLIAHQMGKKVITVSPSSVKKFATGNSSATKKQMMEATGIPNEHIADASAVSDIGLGYLGVTTLDKRCQLEVISQLKNPTKKVRSRKRKPLHHISL